MEKVTVLLPSGLLGNGHFLSRTADLRRPQRGTDLTGCHAFKGSLPRLSWGFVRVDLNQFSAFHSAYVHGGTEKCD